MQRPRTNDPRTWRGRDWPEHTEYEHGVESHEHEVYEPRAFERSGTEPNRSAHAFERDRGRGDERDFSDREHSPRRGRAFEPEMHDPRTGERVPRHAGYAGADGYQPYSRPRGGSGYEAYVPERYRDDDPGYGPNRTDDDDRYPTGAMRGVGPGDRATPWNRDREADTRFTGAGYHYPGGARYPEESGRRDGRRLAHLGEHESWDPDDRDEFWQRGEYGSRLYGNVVGAATPSGTAGISRYRSGAERRGPKGYARSDERLRDDICERLSNETWIDLSEVEVHVNDGHVTLDGDVPDRFSKYAIEDIADDAWGVKDVDNRIRIRIS